MINQSVNWPNKDWFLLNICYNLYNKDPIALPWAIFGWNQGLYINIHNNQQLFYNSNKWIYSSQSVSVIIICDLILIMIF